MKKGGGWWMRIKDWVPTKFSIKELFCPGKTFLPQGKFFVNWVNFSYPNYSLGIRAEILSSNQNLLSIGKSFTGQLDVLKSSENYHDWTKPILPLWCTQKQTKHKEMRLYWILFIEKALVNNRYAGWWRWGKLYDKMKVEEIFVNVWRCCKRFRGIV